MAHPVLAFDGGAPSASPSGRFALPLLAVVLALALSGNSLTTSGAAVAAALAILILGLPHGAYDLQLLTEARHDGLAARVRLLAAYLALLALAACLWFFAPALALLLFLGMAAVHFGEDWTMLEPGLLRHLSGFSIVAAVTIASPADVSVLFSLLSDAQSGPLLARAIVMTAPMVLLVTLVAMTLAASRGHWRWSAAHALALAIALLTPPVVGFAAYFVIVHSAMHLRSARAALADWPLLRFCVYGLCLSGLSVAVMLAIDPRVGLPQDLRGPLLVFRLLAVLTVPHLLLTHHWLPRFAPDDPKQKGREFPPGPYRLAVRQIG